MISKILLAGFCNELPKPIQIDNEDKCIEVEFSIHSFGTYLDNSGVEKPTTEFYKIKAYGYLANEMYKRLNIGMSLFIEAHLTTDLELIATKIEFNLRSTPGIIR